MSVIRFLPRRPRTTPQSPIALRYFRSTPSRLASAGYGDPQSEKADNHTPTPSSTPDPQPSGQGQAAGQKSGTTDPEVTKDQGGKVGSAGGAQGAGSEGQVKSVKPSDIRETKKVGENPKQEQESGQGPIGG